jgi:hypothetical protein
VFKSPAHHETVFRKETRGDILGPKHGRIRKTRNTGKFVTLFPRCSQPCLSKENFEIPMADGGEVYIEEGITF